MIWLVVALGLFCDDCYRQIYRWLVPWKKGVVQELYGLMLGHCVLRTLMHEAAKKVPVSPLRISFVGTLKILRCRLPECPQSPPARQRWWRNLLEEIAEEVIPERRDRINLRAIKRRMRNWLKKRRVSNAYPRWYHEKVILVAA